MITFNGDKKLKKELLKKLKHHQKLDTFIQGQWLTDERVAGNGFKGCFYGCTMQTEDDPIEKFSEKYSIDLWFCYLTEKLFENLPDGEYQKFPLESIKHLPVGLDMNTIKSKYHYTLLENQLQYCKDNEKVTAAIKKCMDLFKADFDKIDRSAAESACSACSAWSAESAWSARSAARSAWLVVRSARSSARSAWLAAESACSAAESARSSARSAWSAAESAHYVWQRDLLFKILKDATK